LIALVVEVDGSSFGCFCSHQVWQDIEEYTLDGDPTGARSLRAIEGMKEQHFLLPFMAALFIIISAVSAEKPP
jgi:hypothetical protein